MFNIPVYDYWELHYFVDVLDNALASTAAAQQLAHAAISAGAVVMLSAALFPVCNLHLLNKADAHINNPNMHREVTNKACHSYSSVADSLEKTTGIKGEDDLYF